jgi:prepilin-type processing-associated H-X9-DG protein
VQNYASSFNVVPAMTMYPGYQSSISLNWGPSWIIPILPQIEQGNLFSSYNFSAPSIVTGGTPSGLENTTVTYTQIAAFLCPSEDQTGRPALTATTNYYGNFGGPGQIAAYTGVIVPIGDPNGASPLGRLGPVTLESIRDGLSNTAMFSEKLHGLQGIATVHPGTDDGKRGVFVGPAGGVVGSGAASATTFVQACQTLPYTASTTNAGLFGNNAYASYPWNIGATNYNHVGAPNSNSCENASDPSGSIYTGPVGSCPPTSNHPGGVHVGFADGSVRFIKNSISQQAWWAIGTRNGREIVSSDSL